MYTVHESYKIYILFYSAPEIKYIISFSLSLRASLSLSHSALILYQDSLNLSSSHPLSVTLLSHRHSLNLPHSPPPARPNRPKPPITSPSLSSLIVTLSSSLIHRRWPDPTVPSCQSPQTHAVDCLRPTPLIHPFCRPSLPTLCLFVIGHFLFCL